jgi:ribose transport system ATP-binding protein
MFRVTEVIGAGAGSDTGPSGTLLDVRSLSKTFPGQVALDGASFHVRRGEIHALLGLNGSGKSTLIKILSGYHHEDAGSEVRLFGTSVAAHQARALYPGRVAILHQDLGLVNRMSIAENMGLGAHFARTRSGRIRWAQHRSNTAEACRRLGLEVDPRLRISELDASSRVVVGLARAISSLQQIDGSIVFADEPTAALGRVDVELVFRGLRELASAGAGVVVVTHRLEEVLGYCDSLTVLRDGRTIAEGPTAGLDKARLAQLLTGRKDGGESHVGTPSPTVAPALDPEPLLRVRGLRGRVIEDMTFDVGAGEVVGIAGLVGSGREELGPLLVGAHPRSGGTVSLRGRVVAPNPRSAARAGMGFVPADRKGDGLLSRMSVGQNMTVNAEIARGGGAWLDSRRHRKAVEEWIGRMRVEPPDPGRRISLLSGGNQQKVVLARWLRLSPSLMVLDDPMQGVDVSAKESIYRIIRDTARLGSGVVLISSDSIELSEAADRVLVLREGRVQAELTGASRSSENIIMEVEG